MTATAPCSPRGARAGRGRAQAQLAIEITGARRAAHPDRDRAVRRRGAAARRASPRSCAPTSSAAACSARWRVPALNPPPTEASNVNYADGARAWPTRWCCGSVAARPDGRFEVRFRLFDIVKAGPRSAASPTPSPREQARATAHRIADFVYEKLTGEKGVFSTRIAYVVKRGTRPSCRSPTPTAAARRPRSRRSSRSSRRPGRPTAGASPTSRSSRRSRWSTCTRCSDGKRQVAANFRARTRRRPGRPTARGWRWRCRATAARRSSWSNADGSGARRLTQLGRHRHRAASSRPTASSIYFTSDRGGSPQIYRMPASGGEPQRVTFEGSYNVSPRISPDGKMLAYVTRNGGQVPGRDAGSGDAPDADHHRQRPRRVAELRAQRPHDPARHRHRRARRARRGVQPTAASSSASRCRRRRARAGLGTVHRMNTEVAMREAIASRSGPGGPRRLLRRTPDNQPPAEVEDRTGKPPTHGREARPVNPALTGTPITDPSQDRSRAEGPGEHPLASARSSTTSTSTTSRTSTAAGRGARQVPAREPDREDADPGQHRRARQPRVQRRPRPAPLRRREAHADAARRAREPDRVGQPGRGEAACAHGRPKTRWSQNRRSDILYGGEF